MISVKKNIILALFCVLALSWPAGPGHARDVDFNISLSSETAAPGRQVRLHLIFPGHTDVPRPDIPFIDGLNIRYSGLSVEQVEIGGRPVDSTMHTYRVIPRDTGSFKIGPLKFTHRGITYVSNAAHLAVTRDAPRVTKEDIAPQEQEMGISDRIFLEVHLARTDFYINERIPITAKFYSDWLDVEQVQVWDAPSSDYVTGKYETGETTIITRDDTRFVVVSFNKHIFIPRTGEFDYGPVLAKCDIMKKTGTLLNDNEVFYNSYIGRGKSRTLELAAPVIRIKVLPLPAAERPETFRGAVGDFTMEAELDRGQANVDDLITLTVTVSGDGNLMTVNPPIMEETDKLAAYTPQTERQKDKVVFKQLLKVRSPDTVAIPEAVFSFFSPTRREYGTIRKGPFRISVSAPDKIVDRPISRRVEDALDMPAVRRPEEDIGEGIIYIKDSPGRRSRLDPNFYLTGWFFFLQALPLFLLASSIVVSKNLKVLRENPAYLRRILAIRKFRSDITKARSLAHKGVPEEFYGHTLKMMQSYFGRRLAVPGEGITEDVTEILGAVEEEAIDRIKIIFRDCWLARYGEVKFDKNDIDQTFDNLKQVIEHLNSKKDL